MKEPTSDVEAVMQVIVCEDMDLGMGEVQANWDSYRSTELRWEAQKFIAMHDALVTFRREQQ